jgi:molecular chaperone GrpE
MFKSKKEKLEKEILKEELENVEEEERESAQAEEQDKTSEKETGIAGLEKQVHDFKDKYLRKAAEFENYKRRTEAEISSLYRYAGGNLIYELLPVLDDFIRLKKAWDENHDPEVYRKGMELVYEKFTSVLEKQGLKQIDAAGKPFDVNLHEAVMQIPTNEHEANIVVEVIENGYYLKDKVLRHAKVIVSKPPDEENK